MRSSPSAKGRDFYESLGKAINTLERPEEDFDGEEITIKNFAYAGSYNWVEAEQPTILVPGALFSMFSCD